MIYADVTPSGTTPTQYTLEATFNGTTVQFVNGDTKIYFTGSSSRVRLAGQFDARSYTTNVYPLVVTVTAWYADGSHIQHSYSRSLVVVNEAHSPLGRGWTVQGVQHLYISGTSYIATDGSGSAVYFSGLGVQGADYSTLTNPGGAYYLRTYLDGSQEYFTAAGQDTLHVDRLNFHTRYTYSGTRLQSVCEPERYLRGNVGMYLTLSYGTYGISAISEVTTGGRVTQFTVASDSTLRTVTDPDGVATHYAYDSSLRLQNEIDRRGDTTTYVYDTLSWKIKEVDLPRIAADIGSGSTTNVVPKVKLVPWQTFGIPTSPTSSSAPSTPPLQSGIHATITDPVGHTTTMTLDRWGQPLVITDPLSRITTITRSGMLPVKVAHPNTGVDTMAYVSGTPLPSYLRTAGDSARNFHYGAKNQIDSIWGPGMSTERHFLNATTGRVDSVQTMGSTAKVRYTYDSFNRPISVKDAGTHTTTYHYNAIFGNIDSVSRPGNIYAITRFDSLGRDTAVRSAGALVWQCIRYDTLNRVRKVWHRSITNDTTIVTYDSLFPVRVRGPGGEIYKFATNALGWTTRRYDSKDTTLYISYRYDTAGHLTSYTNCRGQSVTITYDALGRMLSRTVNATLTDYFGYDLNDRWTSAWRNNVSRDTTFFNINGEIDSVVNKIAGYRYASYYYYVLTAGRVVLYRSHLNNAGFSMSGATDVVRSLMPTTDSAIFYYAASSPATTTRDIDGRPTLLTTPQGVQIGTYFNALHRQYWSSPTSALKDSLSQAYTLDSLGRATFDAQWPDSIGHVRDRSFIYDSLGQLLKVQRRVDQSCSTVSDTLALGIKYTCGTPISTVTQDSATSYSAAGNRMFPGATYSPTGNRLLTGPAGVSYTYDADGNLLTRTHGGTTDSFYWSAVGLLDSVTSLNVSGSGLRRRYEYNSYGQLVRRQTAGGSGPYVVDRYFLWDDGHLLAELDAPGTSFRAEYGYSGNDDQPITIITPAWNGATFTPFVRTYYQDPVEGNMTGIMDDTLNLQQ